MSDPLEEVWPPTHNITLGPDPERIVQIACGTCEWEGSPSHVLYALTSRGRILQESGMKWRVWREAMVEIHDE
jgi:hypothetical protein